jgi:mycothiol system anti-sigma-R factor
MICEEAQELITALVDGELLDHERGPLESHLRECPQCSSTMEQEQLLKQMIRDQAAQVRAPAELRRRIFSDRRIFPGRASARWHHRISSMRRFLLPALAAGLLLAIGVSAFWMLKPPSEPVAAVALGTYSRFAGGELSIDPAESPEAMAERLTRAAGGHLHPMGYDLSAMDLRPVAGLVREIQGRKILVTIYQGLGGTLLCYTFLGSEQDAPPNSAKFVDASKKINFYAFSRGGVNAVLHREGDVICILASDMPMDKLLALARGKARPS